jgi:hypothetical protein
MACGRELLASKREALSSIPSTAFHCHSEQSQTLIQFLDPSQLTDPETSAQRNPRAPEPLLLVHTLNPLQASPKEIQAIY